MRHRLARASSVPALIAAAALALSAAAVTADPATEHEIAEATALIRAFTDGGPDSIPDELLERARGIAVVPKVIRGGFIVGARRGRGVLSIRTEDGSWSNPAFVTLTGGSIGWQIGADSTDIVLVFANDNAVRNIATGKFTLGGEATAVAGPLRKQASSAMTFRAEVYGYVRSRGLYAGAAFQGARLSIDEERGRRYYGDSGASALSARGPATPTAVSDFLLALEAGFDRPAVSVPRVGKSGGDEALTFPLPD